MPFYLACQILNRSLLVNTVSCNITAEIYRQEPVKFMTGGSSRGKTQHTLWNEFRIFCKNNKKFSEMEVSIIQEKKNFDINSKLPKITIKTDKRVSQRQDNARGGYKM